MGYVEHAAAAHCTAGSIAPTAQPTCVAGVVLHRLTLVDDPRGMLSAAEVAREIPFEVKRYFVVFQVPTEEMRGEHAHRVQYHFLVCVHGRCSVLADDGVHRHEFLLDAPNLGLYIAPMTWAVQYKFSRDAVLLVLASGHYDPADYIRNYAEFLSLKK
jgi:dTDP-4-dehydrorhamnose 3,5-epimerase-like enzyme